MKLPMGFLFRQSGLLGVIATVFLPGLVWAESSAALREDLSREPPLQFGMSFRDVIHEWGPALEKEEFESSRRNRWRYARADILFREGKVSEIVLPGFAETLGSIPQSSRDVTRGLATNEASRAERVSPETAKLFAEILREIPSNEDSSPEPPAPPTLGGPQVMNPFAAKQLENAGMIE